MAFKHTRLNPRYTFDEFVVGTNSRFPHAAAQAVAENPGKAYNPLFIYGPVGLGKTHLMQAIGHRILEKNPSIQSLYVGAEQFMSEVIEAIEKGFLNLLREKYRTLDLLMLDDVQFLASSESTQEEFFHVFNVLHQNEKQIIITSDRPPKMLTTLEDRLRNRFEWGLTADIKSPNLETRVAILKKKEVHLQGLSLDEDIRLYIAGRLKANVRELEGFLSRIQAYAKLNNQPANMALVTSLMKDLLPPGEWEEATTGEPSPPPAPAPSVPAASAAAAVPSPAASAPPPPPAPPGPPPEPVSAPAQEAPVIKLGETNVKAVQAVFFFPEGKDAEMAQVNQRFEDVIKKHKLKFQLQAASVIPYPISEAGAYDHAAFAEKSRELGLTLAIILGPPLADHLAQDFKQAMMDNFESRKIVVQIIGWEELSKDYRYLNIALDISLLRIRDA
ncbi:MAG: chromosomal replication initiator protein DnaA [Elusimicrobiota bacterium]